MDHPQEPTPQEPQPAHHTINTWGTGRSSQPRDGRRSRRGPTQRTRNAVLGMLAMLVALALIGLSCTDDGRPPLLSGMGEQSIGLRTDLSCDDLVEATREQFEVELALAESQRASGGADAIESMAGEDLAVEEFDSSGSAAGGLSEPVPPTGDGPSARQAAPPSTVAAPDAASADGADGADGESDTGNGEVIAGTNNQESGVDEADIVKTDGTRIVSLVNGALRVVELDGSPEVDDTLDLQAFAPQGGEMFMRGDEALLLLPAWGGMDGETFPGDDVVIMEDAAPGAATDPPGPAPSTTTPGTAPRSVESTTTSPDTTSSTTSTSTTSTSPTTTAPTTTSSTTTTTVPVAPEPTPLPFDRGVRILRIDLAVEEGPSLVEQRVIEGELVAARMIDGTARVVVRSAMPVSSELQQSEGIDDARATISDMEVVDVLPRTVASDARDIETLGGCGDVAVLPVVDTEALDTASGSGFAPENVIAEPSTVSVLTIGEDLVDLAPATVAGLAEIVYASTDSMFVTSTGWDGGGPQTLVHRFALDGDQPATYTGSGAVPGTPLNQYSLSERDGDLRIVTTTEGEQVIDTPVEPFEEPAPFEGPMPVEPDMPVVPGEPDPNLPPENLPVLPVPPTTMFTTEGRLTVLRPDGSGALVEIGAVEDLGVGERVQSVRFLGDMAYVVTFRQTDPLYAIDLSDPSDPRALGELKITGFSQYLHPVGDGLLLGVGREATEEGFDTGFKVSLFDVSDPTDPVEVDKVVIPDASSLVADDPLAFTWDPEAKQAIIPLERFGGGATRGPAPEPLPTPTIACGPDQDCAMVDPGTIDPTDPGAPVPPISAGQVALVLGVEGNQLVERAQLTHQTDGANSLPSPILRSLVVDRDLWTLSLTGLGRSNADDPTAVEFLAF